MPRALAQILLNVCLDVAISMGFAVLGVHTVVQETVPVHVMLWQSADVSQICSKGRIELTYSQRTLQLTALNVL
jgi:hypothetical protein